MKSKSIRQKLTRSYFILLIAVALVMFIGFSATVWLGTLPNTRLTMQSKTNEFENRLNEQIAYLTSAADTVFLNLNDLDPGVLFGESGNELQRYNRINQSLYLMRQIYSDVGWAFFFGHDGNVYADNILIENELEHSFDSSLHSALEQKHGKTICCGLSQIHGLNGGEPLLLVGKMMVHMSNMERAGYIYVAADQTMLTELYGEQLICAGQNIYICDDEAVVLSSSEEGTVGTTLDLGFVNDSEKLLVRYEGRIWLYQKKHMENIRADVVMMMPLVEMYRASIIYIFFILVSVLIGLGLALYESSSITKRMLNPLREITEKADKISGGDMNIRFDTEQTDDEIRVLSSSFNSMLDRIEILIKRVEQEQKEKLRTEHAMQQNRIQPHFLYNTLNTISVLCEMKEPEEASRMANLVAEYYRLVLSDGKDIVTIEQELHHVELYLRIKLISGGDALSYSINCEKAAEHFLISKMTIQPLVENSIKHAFGDGRAGRIDISVRKADGGVVITVADNGVGMDVDRFKSIVENREQGHFGIFSVCKRMQLLSGGKYKMEAHSKPNEGTQVILSYDASQISDNGMEDSC